MQIDESAAHALPLGTPVRITTIEGPERVAVRCMAPFLHMEPSFRWADEPADAHPLAWFDIAGRVRMSPPASAEA